MPVELIPSIEIINDNTYKTYSVYQANTKQISEIELSRIKSIFQKQQIMNQIYIGLNFIANSL